MPTPTREQVYSALYGLVSEVQWNIGTETVPDMQGFATTTRKIKLFSDVPGQQQPWFGQAEHSETVNQKTNLPYKRVFSASWMVYHQAAANPSYTPSTLNNLIADALEDMMAPRISDPGWLDERNTLSGLVWHCFIEGEVFKDPGDIDGQGLLIIPIKILVP